MTNGEPTPARMMASLILMIGMIVSGLAAVVALAGNSTLSVQICGVGVVIAIVIMLIGAFLVARHR
jgi:hypothetical protein